MGISQNTFIRMRASILLTLCMLVLLLDVFANADDDVDRTFNLFKKKKEKLKEKEKKPKYKPDGLKRTFFKKKHKNKEKPSYKPDHYPISASRHFGASVLGPHHTYPHNPHLVPLDI